MAIAIICRVCGFLYAFKDDGIEFAGRLCPQCHAYASMVEVDVSLPGEDIEMVTLETVQRRAFALCSDPGDRAWHAFRAALAGTRRAAPASATPLFEQLEIRARALRRTGAHGAWLDFVRVYDALRDVLESPERGIASARP